MIEVFKIIKQKYDHFAVPELLPSIYNATRGNTGIYKPLNHSFHSNLRKFYFTARVVNIWNSLPDYVVAVECVNTFKTRLDKYWKDQDVMYDWTSKITGTGDRSEYIIEST